MAHHYFRSDVYWPLHRAHHIFIICHFTSAHFYRGHDKKKPRRLHSSVVRTSYTVVSTMCAEFSFRFDRWHPVSNSVDRGKGRDSVRLKRKTETRNLNWSTSKTYTNSSWIAKGISWAVVLSIHTDYYQIIDECILGPRKMPISVSYFTVTENTTNSFHFRLGL